MLSLADSSALSTYHISPEEVQVRVVGATRRFRGRVGLPRKLLAQFNLKFGDFVEISGSSQTAAIPWSMDTDETIIIMDGLLRRNAGVVVGETVTIRPLTALKRATQVTLSSDLCSLPTLFFPTLSSLIKYQLLDYPLRAGDIFIKRIYGRWEIKLKVETTIPAEFVLVSDNLAVKTTLALYKPLPELFCPLCGHLGLHAQVNAHSERLTLYCPTCQNSITKLKVIQ